LPALVKGRNAAGKEFEEQTEITSLSASSVSFPLQTRVIIGAKVWLTASIPRTAFLKVPLRLSLVGSVVFVQAQNEGPKRQTVSLRLDKHYTLNSPSS